LKYDAPNPLLLVKTQAFLFGFAKRHSASFDKFSPLKNYPWLNEIFLYF